LTGDMRGRLAVQVPAREARGGQEQCRCRERDGARKAGQAGRRVGG